MRSILKRNYIYIVAFIVPVFLLVLVYALREVYPFGKNSVLVLDLNAQYIYYYEAFRDAFLNGSSLFYSFGRTLGGEFVGTFAYYLASPFSLILLLFPKAFITEAVLSIILLKVGFLSLGFAFYIKSSKKAKNITTIMFSVMYALMSYVIIQTMNPMWLDALILLPIIILSVERLVDKGKFAVLVISLAALFITNFYIGYMTGIFVFVYFVYYMFGKSSIRGIKNRFRKTFAFFGSAGFAVGISAFLLLPTYFSLKMGKLAFTSPNFAPIQKIDIFDLFSKMLPVTYDSINYPGYPFVFAGTIVLLLTGIYFINKKISSREKIAAAGFISFIIVCFMVSTLDVVLHGFQFPNWLNFRYSFILSFFLLSISYDAFVRISAVSKKTIAWTAVVLVVAISLIGRFQYGFIVIEKSIWAALVLVVFYSIMLYLMMKTKRKKVLGIILTIIISLEMGLNAYVMIDGANKEVHYSDRPSYREYFDRLYPLVDFIKENDKSFYRAETVIRRTVNDPLALGLNGISHSSSTLNAGVIPMLHKLGLASQEHWTRYKGTTMITDSILGIKYMISEKEVNGYYKPLYTENNLTVYENQYTMPVAYIADKAVAGLVLDSVDPFINQNALLSNLLGQEYTEYFKLVTIKDVLFENMNAMQQDGYVVYTPINPTLNAHIEYLLEPAGNNEIYMYLYSEYPRKVNIWLNKEYVDTFYNYESNCIMPLHAHPDADSISLITTPIEKEYFLSNNMFYYLDTPLFESSMEQLKKNDIEITRVSDTYLKMNTSTNDGDLLFTTIPFEKGWRITVNGKKVEPIEVLDSLIAIELSEGEQNIEFKFTPQGLVAGAIISVLSLIGFIIFGIYLNKKKKHRVE